MNQKDENQPQETIWSYFPIDLEFLVLEFSEDVGRDIQGSVNRRQTRKKCGGTIKVVAVMSTWPLLLLLPPVPVFVSVKESSPQLKGRVVSTGETCQVSLVSGGQAGWAAWAG